MITNLLASIILISPLLYFTVAAISRIDSGLRPSVLKRLSNVVSLFSIALSVFCGLLVFEFGLLESKLIGLNELGLSVRLDTVSILMFSMIALLSFIVLRFSYNYMDGDERQGAFIGRLGATIASVQLLVLSGNLFMLLISWVLTSICLHRLLIFYEDRPGAVIAARKKFIVARLGDLCLAGAAIILYFQFGSGNLEVIFQGIKNNVTSGVPFAGLEITALLLAFAAILKSAQFPTHGWLIEVMETPTPVSALLHAGLLNAGPYLIIRMAFIMDASTYAPLVLMTIGGFTALFASVVFLTQTSVKTALGYSSIAHMGFSLMVCGLGVYPAAMLHLVAHSFYKAHSFLSSGSVIEMIRSSKLSLQTRVGSPFKIALGIILALGVYTGFAIVWGIDPVNEFSLLAIGGIIVMGLSRIFISAIDSNGSLKLVLRASILAVVITTSFFTLEAGTHMLLAGQVPEIAKPQLAEVYVISFILLAFATTVGVQILAPFMPNTSFNRSWAVHLRNGLYVNTVFDRVVGALHIKAPQTRSLLFDNDKVYDHEKSAQEDVFEKQSA